MKSKSYRGDIETVGKLSASSIRINKDPGGHFFQFHAYFSMYLTLSTYDVILRLGGINNFIK